MYQDTCTALHVNTVEINESGQCNYEGWSINHSNFLFWEYKPSGKLKYTYERTRNGLNSQIDYCTWHIGPHTHRSPCLLPVAGCFATSLKFWYPPRNYSICKNIIHDRFYLLSMALSGIYLTENGYSDIRTLFRSGHIHPARMLLIVLSQSLKVQGQVTVSPSAHSDPPSTPWRSAVVVIWHHSGQVGEWQTATSDICKRDTQ